MPKRARAALVAGIAATALAVMPVSPASASIPMCPLDHSCMYDYFDSPEKTVRIGYADQFCDGTVVIKGEMSRWIEMTSRPC